MAGIGANLPVAKNPVGASGRLEDFPVEGTFVRHPVPKMVSLVGLNRGLDLSIRALTRQLTAMPCDCYLIRLIHRASRKALPGERCWTVGQLLDPPTVRFLRARNSDGYEIYFQPFTRGRTAGYILVDLDCSQTAVVDVMFANGHQPCTVIETSPGHLQAWVRVSPQPLPVPIATAIARQLAHLYQADPASADGCHLGRLAGFTNQKLHRRLPTGLPPWVKVLHAAALLASQGPALVEAALGTDFCRPTSARVRSQFQADGPAADVLLASISPADAATVYQTWLQRLHILDRFSNPDWSIADLWIAKELLRRKVPAPEVKTVLRLASPHFPRCHSDPEDYLRRTLTRALHELACVPFPARDLVHDR